MALLPKKHMQVGGPLHCMCHLQEGRHGVEELLSTMSLMRNSGIHHRNAGAHVLPPVGQFTYCGMYPTASASLKHRGAEDFLSVCLGSNVSSARASDVVYRCHVARVGWHFRSYVKPIITRCDYGRCQCHGTCSTMVIACVQKETMMTPRPGTQQALRAQLVHHNAG
jgi:hypothetical protein